MIEAEVGIHGTGYHDMHGDAPRGYARGVVVRRHVDEGYSARQAGFVGGKARQTRRGQLMEASSPDRARAVDGGQSSLDRARAVDGFMAQVPCQ